MTNRYFSPLSRNYDIDGKHVLQDTGTMYNGYVVDQTGGTSGSITLSTGSGIGLAYDQMTMVQLPSSLELVANLGGDYCAFLRGSFRALVGADLFTEAALPDVDATIYDNANGLLRGTSSTLHKAIGRCEGRATVQHKDGSYEVARCYFDFTQIL